MKSIAYRLLIACCMLALTACSTRTGQQVFSNLWGTWEAFEQQVQADYPDAVPIVLVHGWNGGEFSWPDPKRLMRMEQELKRDIYFFTYRTGLVANRFPPIELLEEQLDIYLNNYKQVDVVAHSMGGLLIRQYLSHHADNPVRRMLFLSTPHFGSDVANVLVEIGNVAYVGNIQATELLPGSDFLWQLNRQQGAELEGKEALNVYAREQKALLKGDLVVRAAHAWLPWAYNATVDGDHHLGRSIDEPWAMNFLRDGVLPPAATMPAGRELWLRFRLPGRDTPATLNETSIRRFEAGKPGRDKRFELCCDERSGLHPVGGTTLILEQLRALDRVKFYPRHGLASRVVDVGALHDGGEPVQLRLLQLPPESGMP